MRTLPRAQLKKCWLVQAEESLGQKSEYITTTAKAQPNRKYKKTLNVRKIYIYIKKKNKK